MTAAAKTPTAVLPARAATLRLMPVTLVTFLGFFTIGVTLAALPLQVGETLGYGAVVVGLTVALQSIATLATRPLAGALCDTRGGKLSALLGMASFTLAGVCYFASVWSLDRAVALALLCLGRALAGFGESALITGALSWTIATVGPKHTGRAMVWIGIAMFGAISVGAPIGLAFGGHQNAFGRVALLAIAAPILGALITLPLRAKAVVGGTRLPFHRVVGLIWLQGAGLALAAMGYGVITTFTSLFYHARNWDGAGWALTAFGGAYILARLLFGHLPDRIGGRPVAIASIVCEVAGLALMALAGSPAMALGGALLTGFGFSLVFPSLGAIAVHRVPPASRGAALGGYVAFLDIGLALAGPITGAIVARQGFAAAYACMAVAVAFALVAARGSR